MKKEGSMGHKVMIIDDDPLIARSLRLLLKSEQYDTLICENGMRGIEMMDHFHADVVLLDVQLGDVDGLEVLRHIKNSSMETRVIMITAYGTIENTVQAMQEGAFDYLTKPFDNRKVKAVVRKALEYKPVYEYDSRIDDCFQNPEKYGMSEVIAGSSEMKKILEMVKRLGGSGDTTVLIEGESGVGKEWVSEYIHFLSPRFEKAFLKLNCACIAETLAESELFGYERGAFTGGGKDGKPGLFEMAEGGTLLLDEVAELSLSVQSKLLRVIEEGTYFRVGGTKEVRCNVRIIASTNKNLLEEIQKKRFRQDLYYRLSVVRMIIPPLRERKDDILPLVRYFLDYYCRKHGKPIPELSLETEKTLNLYCWKGNVRELRNAMERVTILENCTILRPGHLEFLMGGIESADISPEPTISLRSNTESPSLGENPEASCEVLMDPLTYDEMMKKLLTTALREAEGNQVKASKILGISRAKLRYQLAKYNLL